MVQKAASIVGLLVFIGVGMLLSVTAMVSQLVLSPQSHVKRVLTYLNWPVDRAVMWYAHAFHNGNTDQLIPQAMVLWAIYWLMLGGCPGFGRLWSLAILEDR